MEEVDLWADEATLPRGKSRSFLVRLSSELSRLGAEQKKARQIFLYMALLLASLCILLIWCHMSSSMSLTALTYLLTFDLCSLGVALLSLWIGCLPRHRPSSHSYHRQRMEVVAVFTSVVLACLGAFFIMKECAERLFEPAPVRSGRLVLGALLALAVHLACVYGVEKRALAHVMAASASSWLQEHVTDMSESLCQVVPGLSKLLLPRLHPASLLGVGAAAVVLAVDALLDAYDYTAADTLGGVLIALMTLGTMWPMAVYCGRILLQTTPTHLLSQLDKALREAATLEGVLELREEHFWTLGFGRLGGSLHVRVRRDANEQLVLAHVTHRLCDLVPQLTIQIFKDDWTRMAGSYQYNMAPLSPAAAASQHQHQEAAPVNSPPRHNPFLAENLPDLLVPSSPSQDLPPFYPAQSMAPPRHVTPTVGH